MFHNFPHKRLEPNQTTLYLSLRHKLRHLSQENFPVTETTKFLLEIKKSKRLIRVTIVGEGAVGKTTIVTSILNSTKAHEHSTSTISTIEKTNRTPFMIIETWKQDGLTVQCFDLAGQRKTPGAHPLDILKDQVLKMIDIVILVFALDRYESFENIYKWMQLMGFEDGPPEEGPLFILVGNKCDLEQNVSRDLVTPLVGPDKMFETYIETSATENIGIKKLLEEIARIGNDVLGS
ncbi:MAG: GTP-binding protein [Candidatus Lokiarchaeota archaeon]|nr:GTP-binding protein [Candidatus Lokiarchaeota archaeon]